MKKLPAKFKYPLMVSMVLPTMLMTLPGIMAYRTLPEGAAFLPAWGNALAMVIPSALAVLAVVAPSVRLLVTKVLIEAEQPRLG